MAIVARHPARVVPGPARGRRRRPDAGIAAATGEAIAFLGQDDRYTPVALAALERALDANPGAGLALRRRGPLHRRGPSTSAACATTASARRTPRACPRAC